MSRAWRVRLTEQAELDLLGISRWTAENFGARQAESYAETVTLAIEALNDGPEIFGGQGAGRDNPGRLYPTCCPAWPKRSPLRGLQGR